MMLQLRKINHLVEGVPLPMPGRVSLFMGADSKLRVRREDGTVMLLSEAEGGGVPQSVVDALEARLVVLESARSPEKAMNSAMAEWQFANLERGGIGRVMSSGTPYTVGTVWNVTAQIELLGALLDFPGGHSVKLSAWKEVIGMETPVLLDSKVVQLRTGKRAIYFDQPIELLPSHRLYVGALANTPGVYLDGSGAQWNATDGVGALADGSMSFVSYSWALGDAVLDTVAANYGGSRYPVVPIHRVV